MDLKAKEHAEQVALIKWKRLHVSEYAGLECLYSVPNAESDMKKLAYKKAEGLLAGVSDLCLPIARGKYHGLYIEMKKRDGGNKGSEKQVAWGRAMHHYGNKHVFAWGFDEARQAIRDYYSLGEFGDDKICREQYSITTTHQSTEGQRIPF